MVMRNRKWLWLALGIAVAFACGILWTKRVGFSVRNASGDESAQESRAKPPDNFLPVPTERKEAVDSRKEDVAVSSPSVEDFGRQADAAYSDHLEEYHRDLSDFFAKAAAYRNAWPEFSEFAKLYEEVLAPVVIEGLKCQSALRRENISVADEGSPEPEVTATGVYWFGDITRRLHDLVESGRLVLSSQDQEELQQITRFMEFSGLDGLDSAPACPYQKGTREYEIYMVQLTMLTRVCVDSMSKALFALPPELVESKKKLEERQAELRDNALSVQGRMLPEIVEPYVENILAVNEMVQESKE